MLNYYNDIDAPIKSMNKELEGLLKPRNDIDQIVAMINSGDANQQNVARLIISQLANDVVNNYVAENKMSAEQIEKIASFIKDAKQKAEVARRQILDGNSKVKFNLECEIAVANSFAELAPTLKLNSEKAAVHNFAEQNQFERLSKLEKNNKKLAKYEKLMKKNPEKAAKKFEEFANRELEKTM